MTEIPQTAEIQYRALQLGMPKYLSIEEAKNASRVMQNQLARNRAWTYWVKRVKKYARPYIKNEAMEEPICQ